MLRIISGKLSFASAALSVVTITMMLMAAPAAAQAEPAGPITVSGGVNVVSDYRPRGISLSGGKVALQPSLTIEHESGLYAGGWASNTEDSDIYGRVEVDLYAGYAKEIASGTVLDVGLIYYWFPDGDSRIGPSDFAEVMGKVSHTIGPIEANGFIGYAWDQASLGNDNWYMGAGLAAGIPDTPITVKAGVSHTHGALAGLAPSGHYWEYSVGASAVIGPVIAGVRYVDTSIPNVGVKALDKYYNSGVIFSLGLFF